MASMLQNKLLELPDSLSDLKSLKSLDVSQNLLTTLNENVFKIGSLEYLVVVGNRHGSILAAVPGPTNSSSADCPRYPTQCAS